MDYDETTLRAIESGVMSYEIFAAHVGGVAVPSDFILPTISVHNGGANFGLDLATAMQESCRELKDQHPVLAEGIVDLCEANLGYPSQQLGYYALCGAAVVWLAHSTTSEAWGLEQLFLG